MKMPSSVSWWAVPYRGTELWQVMKGKRRSDGRYTETAVFSPLDEDAVLKLLKGLNK